MEIEKNTVYNCDCLDLMAEMPDDFIDMTVTSPPYDSLRTYKGYSFEFEKIAKELFRVTKQGGVLVWVVGDQIIDGGESLTSFKQALHFKEEVGFSMHDTMIYEKGGLAYSDPTRYNQSFEYMFVLKKGSRVKTFNPIEDKKNKYAGEINRGVLTERRKDGSLKVRKDQIKRVKDFGRRGNIWYYSTGMMNSSSDKIAFNHPAIMPEKLARDHIVSWTNEDDIVFDPFMGSGTTFKQAIMNRRYCIGSEISEEYCNLMKRRFKDLMFTKQFKVVKI